MNTTQNNSRVGLYILATAMAIVFAAAVWAKPVQTMEGFATVTSADMPVQIATIGQWPWP